LKGHVLRSFDGFRRPGVSGPVVYHKFNISLGP